mmetsp:Transcript_13056/g.25934  ORF Transcript_13056/g.25934 Transcript_13056/m.25934 type:complete len:210 (-) Transcript_13056:315-944(-)
MKLFSLNLSMTFQPPTAPPKTMAAATPQKTPPASSHPLARFIPKSPVITAPRPRNTSIVASFSSTVSILFRTIARRMSRYFSSLRTLSLTCLISISTSSSCWKMSSTTSSHSASSHPSAAARAGRSDLVAYRSIDSPSETEDRRSSRAFLWGRRRARTSSASRPRATFMASRASARLEERERRVERHEETPVLQRVSRTRRGVRVPDDS